MELRIKLVAIAATAAVFFLVLELVRRRRLMERYAVLWLFSAAVLLVLAVWTDLLRAISTAIGIYYPPTTLFVIAFGFVLALLVHFSLAISRLTDQSKLLAQRVGLLQTEIDELRAQQHELRQLDGEAAARDIHEARSTGVESTPQRVSGRQR